MLGLLCKAARVELAQFVSLGSSVDRITPIQVTGTCCSLSLTLGTLLLIRPTFKHAFTVLILFHRMQFSHRNVKKTVFN